jgi:hypothetical protein
LVLAGSWHTELALGTADKNDRQRKIPSAKIQPPTRLANMTDEERASLLKPPDD